MWQQVQPPCITRNPDSRASAHWLDRRHCAFGDTCFRRRCDPGAIAVAVAVAVVSLWLSQAMMRNAALPYFKTLGVKNMAELANLMSNKERGKA